MKSISEVKKFLEEFVEQEYKVNTGKYDLSVSQEEHSILVEKFFIKFYSLFYGSLEIGGMVVRSLNNLSEKIILANLKAVKKKRSIPN